MRVALLIAAKDLRQRFRDRSALIFAIAAPLGLALIFSRLIGPSAGFHATWVVVDLDGGSLATVLRDDVIGGVAKSGIADVTDLPTEAAARTAIEDGTADAAFVIPQGFTMAIQSGRPTTVEVVGSRSSGLSTDIAHAVAARFGEGVVGSQLAVSTVETLAGASLPPGDVARIAQAAGSGPPPVSVVEVTADLRQLDLATFFSASMAILFLFFSAQTGLLSVFEERRQGTLRRILAGPVRPETVLAGKLLGAFAMSVVAMATLVVATTLLIGAELGPGTRGRGADRRGDRRGARGVDARDLVRPLGRGGRVRERRRGHHALDPRRVVRAVGAIARVPRDPRIAHAARLVPARARRPPRQRRWGPDGAAGGGRAAGDRPRDRGHRDPARPTAGDGMSGIRKTIEIGRVNLLRQLRDRSDVFFVIVLPTLIIVALGLQFGGTTNARLGVVYDPSDADASALVAAIEADDTRFDVRRVERRGHPPVERRARRARGRAGDPGRVRGVARGTGHGRGAIPGHEQGARAGAAGADRRRRRADRGRGDRGACGRDGGRRHLGPGPRRRGRPATRTRRA